MIALIASIFALGIGPLVYQTFGPLKRTDRIVSGFILVVISATLFLDVLPNSFSKVGWVALLLAFLGFIGPTLIERLFSRSANKTHTITILLGILGLVLHASIDGAALQTTSIAPNGESLSLAMILHRLPVGLTIWWLLRPLLGERYALLTLLTMALATVAGFVLNMSFNHYQSSSSFAYIQAFISGSLLHVVFHKPHEDGCMHTSSAHDHAHQNKYMHVEEPQTNHLRRLISQLLNKWEALGILLGATTLIVLNSLIR